MKAQTIINVVANGVLAGGVSAFMVMIYRTGGLIERWPKASSLTLRLSLAGTAAGALGNCLTLSTPADTEILMNCGLAGIFVWAAIFHANLIKHGPITQHQSGPDEGSARQAAGTEGSNL
jgi:hypothetical protein